MIIIITKNSYNETDCFINIFLITELTPMNNSEKVEAEGYGS